MGGDGDVAEDEGVAINARPLRYAVKTKVKGRSSLWTATRRGGRTLSVVGTNDE